MEFNYDPKWFYFRLGEEKNRKNENEKHNELICPSTILIRPSRNIVSSTMYKVFYRWKFAAFHFISFDVNFIIAKAVWEYSES